MKLLRNAIQAGIIGATLLMLSAPPAKAGRVDGPMSQTIIVPKTGSVTFNIQLLAGEPASISVTGDGSSQLEVYVYDADNHIISGEGGRDQKTVRLNVYRAGTFRVLIKNFGTVDNTARLVTN